MYLVRRRKLGIFKSLSFNLIKPAILGGVALVTLVLAEGTPLGIRPAHAATTWTVTTNVTAAAVHVPR